MDPFQDVIPAQPCFRAVVSEENLITLEWRTVNSGPLVYIYDDVAPRYRDPGVKAARCNSGPENGCAVSYRVTEGGLYRWKLMVEDQDKAYRTHVMTELMLASPFAPDVTGGGYVDMLAPSSREIGWQPDARNTWPEYNIDRAWVELRYPDALHWKNKRFRRSNANFTIPASALSIPGDFVYAVRDCHLPPGSQVKFCSAKRRVAFYVGHDYFHGWNNRYVSSGEDIEIDFTTKSGTIRLLYSDTLMPPTKFFSAALTHEPSYTIKASQLVTGSHKIHLVSCALPSGKCTNRVSADRVESTGYVKQELPDFYLKGDIIARATADDGSPLQLIRAPITGVVHFASKFPRHRVEPNQLIAYVTTEHKDTLNIIVDSPVEWETGRDYRNDFEPAVAHNIEGTGQALDVSYGPNDGIWLTREFSNSIEHVTPAGEVTSINLPLARTAVRGSKKYRAVQPFTIWMPGNVSGATTVSSLAERVVPIGGKMWFTQGGGLRHDKQLIGINHSRVISFDPSLRDLSSTEYDDRLCVYNIPTDDQNSYGDNEVLGLTGAHNRIWIAESRGILNGQVSSISSFVPHPRMCVNHLDFSDPEALRSQDLQYCHSEQTPEQDACIEKIKLEALSPSVKVAHLATDPVDHSIWFSDASGQCLGNFNPEKSTPLRIHKLDETHKAPFDGFPGLGGLPWSVQANGSAVYTAEYATRHILRFDKKTSSFNEIAIPYANSQVRLHSLALDPSSDRLWFTLSNEFEVPVDTKASTIGYIDLESWRIHLANPKQGEQIFGVIYSGLDSISAPTNRPNTHQSFRGISINPNSGKLAIGSSGREQIIELTPVSGFWPLKSAP